MANDTIPIYPLNDIDLEVELKTVDPETGRVIPLTPDISPTVTAFLSQSNAPTAVMADGTLFTNCVHTNRGKWLVRIDKAVMLPALLDGLFLTTTPYIIVEDTVSVRAVIECVYFQSRMMEEQE